jgi:hypothetical protein
MAQFGGQTGLLKKPARAVSLLRVDHDAARQETQRAFDGAHVLIGDEEQHAFLSQQAFDHGDHDQIIRAYEFNQVRLLS